ncbi:hypothetical protein BCON_0845g00010 [Botryotinia convoluta]|uniref:Uncharacterized protein n=1 Tax=Botryotinia convoluta TaxID=54673 RepID=A0A4Z1H481_9HELO|nr:hypothetical protein BCON_0845g00010 [Botryotinia convoluta]
MAHSWGAAHSQASTTVKNNLCGMSDMTLKSSQCRSGKAVKNKQGTLSQSGKDSFDSSDGVREATPTLNAHVNLPEFNFLLAPLINGPMTTKALQAKNPESSCSDVIVLIPTS